MEIPPQRVEIDDGIARQLAGPVVGRITAATDLQQVDPALLQSIGEKTGEKPSGRRGQG